MLRIPRAFPALLAALACACSSPSSDSSNASVPLYGGAGGPAPGNALPGNGVAASAGSPANTNAGNAGSSAAPGNPSASEPERGVMPVAIAQGGASGGGSSDSAEAMGMSGATLLPGMGPAPGSAGAASAPMQGPACPEPALFCDDFEDDALGQFPGAPWQNQTGSGGTVRVDGMQAFSGTRAVHVNAPPGQAYRRAYFSLLQNGSNIFPAAAREMFGRAMLWLDATPNATVHWTLIQAEGRAADGTHDAYYRYGGQQQGGAGLMANYETNMGVSTDCYSHSAARMPTQNWTCIEWHFAVASNEMQLWLDGNELSDLHVLDRPTTAGSGCLGNGVNGEWLAPPAFQTLHLGWEQYQQHTNDTNLWVDDVVISTERVGCPAP